VTATPAAGTIDLAPIADTYIEAGTEGTWDHGASDHVDADLSPVGLAYYTFDLRSVAQPVTSALLTLWCTNASADGGTVYRVPSSSWIEGDRTGIDTTSVNGPGLKFVDVDTNGDGQITAADTSPYVPDFTQPLAAIGVVGRNVAVTVDLTSALQLGARVYSFGFRSGNSDGVTYSSRENPTTSQRPRLRLTVAAP
jgi:hypothetical protein